MSKGIVNNRDKFIWDNTHKPDISDVVGEIDDEMDGLLDDHDDKVVDIVGDNMNDLLDAHDDKVVSIVGDNMGTLLTSAASTVQLLAGDLSGIGTTEGVKVGKWDATHDIYARRYTGAIVELTAVQYSVFERNIYNFISVTGQMVNSEGTLISGIVPGQYTSGSKTSSLFASSNGLTLIIGTDFSEGSYDLIVYYLVSTATT